MILKRRPETLDDYIVNLRLLPWMLSFHCLFIDITTKKRIIVSENPKFKERCKFCTVVPEVSSLVCIPVCSTLLFLGDTLNPSFNSPLCYKWNPTSWYLEYRPGTPTAETPPKFLKWRRYIQQWSSGLISTQPYHRILNLENIKSCK